MKCIYDENGCDIKMEFSQKQALKDHEKGCEHRTIHCPKSTCSAKMPISKLISHVKTVHSIYLTHYEEGSYKFDLDIIDFDRNRWDSFAPDLITLENGKQFLTMIEISPNGIWFIYVVMLGTSKDAENFVYTCSITSQDRVNNYHVPN